MLIPIKSVATLGLLLRTTRKSQGLRQDDLAGMAKVGHVFARSVEYGKETVQLGLVLRLLSELGLTLKIDLPDTEVEAFKKLQAEGIGPAKAKTPRRSRNGARAHSKKPER